MAETGPRLGQEEGKDGGGDIGYGGAGSAYYGVEDDVMNVPEYSEDRYSEMQSHIDLRLQWKDKVEYALRGLSPTSCPNDLIRHALILGRKLGEGAFGVVHEACIRNTDDREERQRGRSTNTSNKNCYGWFIAIKVDTVRLDRLSRIRREMAIMRDANVLVQRHVCPNFTLRYGNFLCVDRDREEATVTTVMEEASDSFATMLRVLKRSIDESVAHMLVAFSVQVFAAIAAMALNYGVIHNDLYPRNILVSVVDNMRLRYVIGDTSIIVFTNGMLLKVSDFGMGTGAKYGAPHTVRSSAKAGEVVQERAHLIVEHVTQTSLCPWARDVATWLAHLPHVIWVQLAWLHLLVSMPFESPSDLIHYMEHILSEPFLLKAGIDLASVGGDSYVPKGTPPDETFVVRRVVD